MKLIKIESLILKVIIFVIGSLFVNSCQAQLNNKTVKKWSLMDELDGVKTVTISADFQLPCIQDQDFLNEGTLIQVNTKEPVFHYFFKPNKCTVENSEDFTQLPALPRGRWIVKGISFYRTESSIFYCVILASYLEAGADSDISLIDTTGEGHFNLAFQSSGMKQPIIPDWLRTETN